MSVPLIGFNELRQDPHEAAAAIAINLEMTEVTVVRHDSGMTVLEAEFQPTLELEANGYPAEVARIAQYADPRHPEPYVHPIGPARTWEHRYDLAPAHRNFEQLCLWYPGDPDRLVWKWHRGLIDLAGIARRHLWYEEHFRRTGRWPVEAAPHGHRLDGQRHPILTPDYNERT
jgi:hypothetical protein